MTDETYGIRGQKPPYEVVRSPGGAVVVCAPHVVTEELQHGEAEALARALNMEFETRMLRK